ncbi:MAG: hypothetical protein ACO1NQ_06375 [Flavobacteriales bacterium]
MERERLTRLVQDAAAVDRGDLSELQALAERFPWFAGAQVLRAVGAQRSGEVLSEETVRDAAAHVPSRAVLFDKTHRDVTVTQRLTVVKEEPALGAQAPPVVAEVVQAPVLTGPEAWKTGPFIEIGPALLPVEATVVEETAPVMADEPAPPVIEHESTRIVVEALEVPEVPEPLPTIDTLQPEPAAVAAEAETDLDEDPLERQIMESALSHAYDISWLDVEAAPVRAEKPERPAPVEIPTPRPVVPIAPIQPDGPARHITRHDKFSFTDWLAASAETAPTEFPVAKPAGTVVPEAASDWLRATEEKPKPAPLAPIQPVTEKKGEVDTKSLIDKFIKQQTPAAPQKAEFFTPQQAAKRSLDDKAGMVTETLARVYAKQGNLPKAIEAYKRLALKYPEKSAYFAALQKELEAQLNK